MEYGRLISGLPGILDETRLRVWKLSHIRSLQKETLGHKRIYDHLTRMASDSRRDNKHDKGATES